MTTGNRESKSYNVHDSRTSMNRSMVASVGRYVMRNFMFLYSISAGSGLRTFIAFDDDDADAAVDVMAASALTPNKTELRDETAHVVDRQTTVGRTANLMDKTALLADKYRQ